MQKALKLSIALSLVAVLSVDGQYTQGGMGQTSQGLTQSQAPTYAETAEKTFPIASEEKMYPQSQYSQSSGKYSSATRSAQPVYGYEQYALGEVHSTAKGANAPTEVTGSKGQTRMGDYRLEQMPRGSVEPQGHSAVKSMARSDARIVLQRGPGYPTQLPLAPPAHRAAQGATRVRQIDPSDQYLMYTQYATEPVAPGSVSREEAPVVKIVIIETPALTAEEKAAKEKADAVAAKAAAHAAKPHSCPTCHRLDKEGSVEHSVAEELALDLPHAKETKTSGTKAAGKKQAGKAAAKKGGKKPAAKSTAGKKAPKKAPKKAQKPAAKTETVEDAKPKTV